MKQLLKCPLCGNDPNEDIDDAVYPIDRDYTLWQAGCIDPHCRALVLGYSEEDAITRWNRRV